MREMTFLARFSLPQQPDRITVYVPTFTLSCILLHVGFAINDYITWQQVKSAFVVMAIVMLSRATFSATSNKFLLCPMPHLPSKVVTSFSFRGLNKAARENTRLSDIDRDASPDPDRQPRSYLCLKFSIFSCNIE